MRGAVLLIVLTLLTLQLSGLAASLGDGPCADEGTCPGDVSGGQCPPNCHFCSCCSLPTALAIAPASVLRAPEGQDASWIGACARLSVRDPEDILHVPIASAA